MAVSTLDRKTALLLIDLQRGIVALPVVHPAAQVVDRARKLARAFRAHHLPVVLVNVAGGASGRTEQMISRSHPGGWSDLVPELEAQPEDHRVTKMTWGAFMNTDLAVYLLERGVTQVVIAGISTSIGVESTARQAFEHGLNVTLAIDAMSDMNADAHENSVTRIFPRLGETGTTDEIVDLLDTSRA